MNINNPVPPTQTVVISGQPIKTDATIQNASIDTNATIQNASIATDATIQNASIDTNATVQNFPATQDVSVSNTPSVLADGFDLQTATNEILNLYSTPPDGISNAHRYLLALAGGAGYNGSSWDRLRTPNVFKASGGSILTTTTTIWTPASGKKFRLMGYELCISPDLSYTTPTAINGYLQDGTTQMPFLITVYAPSTVTPSMGQQRSGPNNLGNGYLSSAADNVLGIKFSTASVGGVFFVNAWGTEE